MSRVMLVSPSRNYPMGNEQYPSGALLLLGTMLSHRGHEVKVIHMVADRKNTEDIRKDIATLHPDIVGFTVTTYQTKMTKILSAMVKSENDEITTIAGGSHPSALKGEFLKDFPNIDVAVYGEGEMAMLSLANNLRLSSTKGICYRTNGNGAVTVNPPGDRILELDVLPMPDKRLIDFKRYAGLFPVGRRPCMFIMSSRGCPYNCSFCSKSVFGSRLQQRSPENIVEEIGLLYRYWGVREVHFGDDTFNANLGWAHRLLDLVVAKGYNKKLVFRVALRVNKKIINADLLRHLKEAGVWFIYYGVESGNQKMLDRMHKGITIEEVKRAFKMTHDFGIRTEAFFIVGLPGETVQTIQDSRDLYKEIKPWWGGFSKAMPFPDTTLTREVTEKGHLLCGDYDQLNPSRMVVRTDEMSAEELDRWADRLNKMTRMGKMLKVRQMRYLVTDQLKSVVSEKIWTKPGGSI